MACSHTKNCDLFPQFTLNPALKVWQVHYCEGEFTGCARYRLALEGKAVPLNLLPNGKRVETPRTSTAYGAAALFNAILKERVHMVESLLRTGVDISTRSPEGMTPLMAAASRGNVPIIRLFLSKGADVSATNLHGATAHDMAVQGGFMQAAGIIATAGGRPSGLPLSSPAASAAPPAEALSDPVAAEPEPAPVSTITAAPQSGQVVPLASERMRPAVFGDHYCLRMPARDARQLAQEIAHACADAAVSVEAMVRKTAAADADLSLVIVLTGMVSDPDTMVGIVRRLESSGTVSGPVSCMRLEPMAIPELARTAS